MNEIVCSFMSIVSVSVVCPSVLKPSLVFELVPTLFQGEFVATSTSKLGLTLGEIQVQPVGRP